LVSGPFTRRAGLARGALLSRRSLLTALLPLSLARGALRARRALLAALAARITGGLLTILLSRVAGLPLLP
jgi:hypothetical protein